MAISEKDLLEAGFSKSEVDNLKGRLAAAGGTMQHLIDALSRRFRVSVWITVALVLVMLVTLIAGSRTHILSGGMSSLMPSSVCKECLKRAQELAQGFVPREA